MTKILLILAMSVSLWPVGMIVVTAAGGSSGADTASAPTDTAGAAALAGAQPATETPTSTSTPGPRTAATHTVETNGKTFSCSLLVLAPIDAAAARSKREKSSFTRLKRAINRINRQYPGKTAPASVANRFNSLLARYDASVTRFNADVDHYNRLLKDKCTPE
jgi:hypothetical protein